MLRERRLAAMRAEEQSAHIPHARHGYDPNQPRVRKGNPDGGQWTSSERATGIKLAALEPPGPGKFYRIILEIMLQAIESYRRRNVDDLGGETDDTVALSIFDGNEIWGGNSTSRPYERSDYDEAVRMRDKLIGKYPDVMAQENVGQYPNNAVFHAETTVLLRAANRNGGTLQGRTIEMFVDRPMCPSCQEVLPLVGLELGNPTVIFWDRYGRIRIMKDGIISPAGEVR